MDAKELNKQIDEIEAFLDSLGYVPEPSELMDKVNEEHEKLKKLLTALRK